MALTREQIEELCAAYAIGALDKNDEAVLFEALNQGDEDLQKVFSESTGVSYLLNQSVVHHTPSPLVKRNLIRKIFKGPKRSYSPIQLFDRLALTLGFGNPRFGFIVSLLLVVVVAEIGAFAYILFQEANDRDKEIAYYESKLNKQQEFTSLQSELDQQREILAVLQSPQLKIAFMSGQEINPAGYGKIIWDPVRKIAIVQISKLPAPPTDKDYQLWFLDKSKNPVSVGVFTVTSGKEDYFKVSEIHVEENNEITAFAVTIEPKGGVSRPTGAMYLIGSPSL